jgi:integrase
VPTAEDAVFLSWTLPDLDRRFRDFLDYAEFSLGHSPDTRRNYKGTYGNFRTFLMQGPPQDLARRLFAIEEWQIWNRKRGISQVTLNTYFRQLRPFFRDLTARDGLPDAYQGLKPPPLPAIIPKARSADECRHILLAAEQYPWDTAYERWRAVGIIGIMLYAGLRKGEVLRLRYLDVDLRDETIRINRGKGRHGGKDRVVMVAPELRRILQNYLRERRRCGFTGPGFFASMRTGQPISEATLKRAVETVRRASGIRFSIHSLRHSFVTMLLRSGVPIHVARELAGHSSITTTAGYLRVFDEDKREGVRKLRFD